MQTAAPAPGVPDLPPHLARAYPDQQLHLIMDNYAAHKHPKVKAWQAANPRIYIHFTPTSGSWLNLVEVWFSIIERQAIHRGAFPSVRDLMIKIRTLSTDGTTLQPCLERAKI